MATVIITPEAREQFMSLPERIQERVAEVFVRLGKWPEVSGAKPLSGNLAGQYRIRTGDYRVQFSVKTTVIGAGKEKKVDHTVTVVKVGHRDGFYE